jgi:hypothetical protein
MRAKLRPPIGPHRSFFYQPLVFDRAVEKQKQSSRCFRRFVSCPYPRNVVNRHKAEDLDPDFPPILCRAGRCFAARRSASALRPPRSPRLSLQRRSPSSALLFPRRLRPRPPDPDSLPLLAASALSHISRGLQFSARHHWTDTNDVPPAALLRCKLYLCLLGVCLACRNHRPPTPRVPGAGWKRLWPPAQRGDTTPVLLGLLVRPLLS